MHESTIDSLISNFDEYDDYIAKPARNAIKKVDIENQIAAIKSFRIPNIINQIVYRFFRKSKAERSFEYANTLIDKNIDTPKPIAYYENSTMLLFKSSYYVCEFKACDFTFRELTFDFNMPEWEQILRGFTRFTYQLHENNINFLDHSPGNTLINKIDDGYTYSLVDLNRMQFGPMNLETRIKNFRKLTTHRNMVEIMSDEYSKCSGEKFETIYELMWRYTQDFQEKYHRRRRIKNRLFFWRIKK